MLGEKYVDKTMVRRRHSFPELKGSRQIFAICLIAAAFTLMPPVYTHAEPQLNRVVRGDVSFDKNGAETVIRAGNNSIIDYDSFDVGADERVRFVQPDSSARVLNRVLSENPSMIEGQIQANGTVYLVNPAGVIFGEGSLVNAAQFYAAAGWISERDFLEGRDHFTDINGEIISYGEIRADSVYLLGERVSNYGTIKAEKNTVAMVAGDDIYLGHPLNSTSVKISKKDSGNSQPKPETGKAAVKNAGTVKAKKAVFGAGDMFALGIHNTGSIQAKDVQVRGKTKVKVSGNIDASSMQDKGGNIEITGSEVEISNATIDASGNTGGGKINIGGSFRGEGPLPNARTTFIDKGTVIKADALQRGDGGEIIIWSDEDTAYYAFLSATGGLEDGNGGFAEISGKELTAKGQVDLSAPRGDSGTLLYDPVNIEIVGGTADGSDNPDANNNNVQGDSGTDGTIAEGNTGTGADPFLIYESEIENTNANIILEAEENITVSGDFTGDDILVLPDNDLIMRTSNAAAAGTIDMTSASEGNDLLLRTQGSGNILLEASTSGNFAGDIRAGPLQSDAGNITLQTGNGSIHLTNNIQTDGGDFIAGGTVVIEDAITIDTESGDNSAAGNVDLSSAVVSRINIANSGEAGTFISQPDGGWTTITFSRAYADPVIVATTNTHNGQAALIPEVRNVTANTAEVRICESEGSAGAGCDTHAAEKVGYFVFDAAESAAIPGIEAGTFSVSGESDTTTQTINYAEAFTSTPIVLATVLSDNGANRPVEARVVSKNLNSFSAGICFQNSINGCDPAHPAETVGWIAIDPNNLPFKQENEAGSTGDSVSNSAWTLQNFTNPFTVAPVVIAEQQTDDGTEDNEIDEARNVTTTSVEVRYCEMEAGDTCDSHTSEDVAWYAVAPGLLGTEGGDLTIDTRGTVNGTVDLGGFDNSGGEYLLGLNVNTGGADVFMHGDVLLDSPLGAQFTVGGGGNIILSGNVSIDTEIGGDDMAGDLDFEFNAFSADGTGHDLLLDTQGTTDGSIKLSEFNNAGGFYLNDVTINNGSANIELNGDITLDTVGADTADFIVSGTGDILVNEDITIDLENGDDAPAGTLDISNAVITTIATFESGEAGTFVSPGNGAWVTVNFARSYDSPVVVATSNTTTGNPALVSLVRNITNTSAEIRVCESDGHVAGGCAAHGPETVGYLVFDAADNAAISGVEAGTFDIGGNYDSSNSTINFSEGFSAAPLVFVNVSTENGPGPVEARVTSVSANNFVGGICKQSSQDGCDNGAPVETVTWIAIDPNNVPFPVPGEGGRVTISNSNWTTVNFAVPFTQIPVVLVEDQTQGGGQDIEIDEARNVTLNDAEVRFCELDGPNTCDTHNNDTVAWFALEPFAGQLPPGLNIDGKGTTGGDIRLGRTDDSGGSFLNGINVDSGGGSVSFSGDILLDSTDFVISGGGNLVLSGSVTIDTEDGDDGNAGIVNFGGGSFFADTPAYDMYIDTSSAGNTGGDIWLPELGNNGGLAEFINDLTIDVSGAVNGVLYMAGDILLDNAGADTGDVNYTGGDLVFDTSMSIDTEAGNDGNAGNINLGTSDVYASVPGVDLVFDTGTTLPAGSGGSITMGAAGDNGGLNNYINDFSMLMEADNPSAFIPSANVQVDDDGAGDAGSIIISGEVRLNANWLLDTEAGGDARAGMIDMGSSLFSANAPGLQLTLDASGTSDGNVTLGSFDNTGGQFVGTLNIKGADIGQTGGVILNNLLFQAGGTTILDNAANNFDKVAGTSTGHTVIRDADGFTVGTVLGVNGINAGGAVNLNAGGDDNLLDVQQPVTAGADSSLVSDKMNIAAAVDTGTDALYIIQDDTGDAGDAVNLGAIGDAAVNTLELSDAELDFITSGLLQIGNAQSGDITFSNPVSPALTTTLSIVTGGNVTQLAGAVLTVADLVIEAAGVSMEEANDINNLAAFAAGDFSFGDSDDINLGSVAGLAGLSATGEVYLNSGTDISQTAGAIIEAAGILIDAGGNALFGGDNDVDSFAAAGGNIEFNDIDDLAIDTVFGVDGILAGVSDILITAGDIITLNRSVNVAGTAVLAAGTDFINNVSGAGVLSAGDHFLVYSSDPDLNMRGDISFDFEEYEKNYPEPPNAGHSGLSGFIYGTSAPPPVDTYPAVSGIENSLPVKRPELTDFSSGGNISPGFCTPGFEWTDPDLCNPGI